MDRNRAIQHFTKGAEHIDQFTVCDSEGQISNPKLNLGGRATRATIVSISTSVAAAAKPAVTEATVGISPAVAEAAVARETTATRGRAISLGTRFTHTNSSALEFGLIQFHNGVVCILTVGHSYKAISFGSVVAAVNGHGDADYWTKHAEGLVKALFRGGWYHSKLGRKHVW